MCHIFYILNTNNFMCCVYSNLSRLNKSIMQLIKCVTPKKLIRKNKRPLLSLKKNIGLLIEEYLSSRSEIEKEGSSPSILTGVESIT